MGFRAKIVLSGVIYLCVKSSQVKSSQVKSSSL